MKKFNKFSVAAFSLIVFFAAFLSGKTIAQSATQTPAVVQPMPAPSIKKQNAQQNTSTAQPSSTTKEPTTTSPEKTSGKKETTTAPLDNKIAISDEGTPSEKAYIKPTPSSTNKRKISKK